MQFVLLILVLLLIFGGLPQVSGQWHNWGYGPSGIGFILVIVLVVLMLSGRL